MPLYEGQALADRIIAFLEQRAFRLTGVFDVSEDHRTGLALLADFLFAKDKLYRVPESVALQRFPNWLVVREIR